MWLFFPLELNNLFYKRVSVLEDVQDLQDFACALMAVPAFFGA